VLVGWLGVLACLLLASSPASAGGASAVDGYIVSNPVAGWHAEPSAGVQFVIDLAASIETHLVHESVTIGAKVWNAPTGTGALSVVLGVFPHAVPPAALHGGSPAGDIAAECGNAQGSQAPSAVPNVPGSAIETCPAGGAPGGAITTYAIWVEGNVLATVQASGLSALTVIQISQRESAMIPASGISLGGGSNMLEIGAIAGGGLIVIVVAVLLILRSRRSKEPAWPVAGPLAAAYAPATGAQDWDWSPEPTTLPTAAVTGPVAVVPPLVAAEPPPVAAGAPPAVAGPAPTVAGPAGVRPAAAGWEPFPTAPDTTGGGWQPYAPPRGDSGATAGTGAGVAGVGGSLAPYRDPRIRQPGAAATRPVEPPQAEEAAQAAADWYPIDDNPYLLRYWDGNAWTARRRWDGTDWVDEPED